MSRVGQLGLFSTPAAMLARLEQLRESERSLAADVSAYVPRAGAEASWSQWAARYASWAQVFRAYEPDWTDRAWGAAADQIEAYGEALKSWQSKLTKWPGATVTAPEVQTDESPADKLGAVLKGAAWVAGGLVAAGLAALALSNRRGS